jgi:pSer/pThr/pTyr-binding forkhead associated (FHA) protein
MLDEVGVAGFHSACLMRCPSCAHENPASSLFCQQCGRSAGELAAAAPQAFSPCPRCGAQSPAGMRFCTQCGSPVGAAATAPVAPPTPAAVPHAPALAPGPMPQAMRAPETAVAAARLVSILKDGSDGAVFALDQDQVDVGRSEGEIVLADDPYLSPRHARIRRKGNAFFVRDLESVNGVYVRIREPVELQDGDRILIGQQVLRFELLTEPEAPLGPAAMRGVLVFGTPEVPRVARLVQYTTEGVGRDLHYLYRGETILGRENGDIVFTDDPFLSRRHASITVERATRRFLLNDMGSSNGTALRLRGERPLVAGDQIRIGKHLFRLELDGAAGPGGRAAR